MTILYQVQCSLDGWRPGSSKPAPFNMVYGDIFKTSGKHEEIVNLNVCGFKQSIDQSTILRFPHTKLGKLIKCHSEEAILERCHDYNGAYKEYYFDRCCSNKYQERKDTTCEREWEQKSDVQSKDSSFEESSMFDKELERFATLRCGELRKNLWVRLEKPAYSLSAKLIAIFSISVVLTSIVVMCIHSMPEFQRFDANEREIEDPGLAVVEVICIVWFTTELVVRLAASPNLIKFCKNPMTIIDFVSIIPFYATLAVDTNDEENEGIENMGKVVQILRFMRIFRILKLARHSVGLRSLGATLRHSYQHAGA